MVPYIPPADVAGGFGRSFSSARQDALADLIARDQVRLRQAQEARAQQQQEWAAAEEAERAKLRPLKLTAEQLALRGQILGPVATPQEYDVARGEVERLGLPTADLPEAEHSTAWQTFRKPAEPANVGGWLPQQWFPDALPQAPAETAPMPSGAMRGAGIAPEDIPAVQRAAERGLPLQSQQKMKDADIGRQIQLANLARVQDKDALSREWMAFQREAKIQGMNEAETQREFQRRMAALGYQIDVEKLGIQRETAKREASKPQINEGQAKAVLFGQEVAASLGDFKSLLGKGFNPTNAGGALSVAAAGAEGVFAPVRGLASEDAQIWNNAADQLAQAALRFESGAAIGEKEFGKKIRANIPRMGDSKDVVSRKLQAIDRAAKAFEAYSGKTFSQAPTATSPKVGDTKTFPNGRKAQWDGKGWRAL
jgi:hypothetical protein